MTGHLCLIRPLNLTHYRAHVVKTSPLDLILFTDNNIFSLILSLY